MPPRLAARLALATALFAWLPQARADDPKPDQPVEPKAADADAPLPEGFPDATKPGQIEVKKYPAYRSAITKGEGMTSGSGDMMFFWLFNHIQKNEVAMTAPVINTYQTPGMATDPAKRGDQTMEFLYATPTLGQLGKGTGPVEVVDHPAQEFVCLGLQGEMAPDRMAESVRQLEAWLEEHKAEFKAAGPPRRLGYHGPMTPVARRLWEVQIPVAPAGTNP
jgi:hypothetical protein